MNRPRPTERGRRALASTLLVLRAALKSFGANRNLEIAATLAFYGFLSLMPLLLLSLLVLRRALHTSEAGASALAHVLADLIPAFNLDLVSDLAAITGGGALGVLSGILLLWSMTPLSGALRTALARIFAMPIQRPFLRSKLIDLAAVFVFLLLFLAFVSLKVLLPVPDGWTGRLLAFGLRTLAPVILTVIFLGLFFRVFSPVRLSWRQWLLGALCVTLLWAVMRHLFIAFLQYNPHYGYAFGSLKAIFLLIVWVYYAFAALLLGAEIMANTYRRDALLLRDLLDPRRAGAREHVLMHKFERVCVAGETLFRHGDPGEHMYVILDGRIRLTRDDRELAVMGPGDYFGEMSLLTRAPRAATATALEATRLAIINQENFDLLVRENPVLVRRLLEELARRLATANQKIAGG
ncbi:MAG TPA: YhjD/YihY/BrkB family envelope integrity protein [Kiritimatiellia bacterium]|nr:YhjD/YihY/BrkB family envelope integrity protein [Kiritimatiellia bacterium]HMO98723.1 YhjD/YihY/BrkB family envelope integrity protein [Kiritimatiellia bacterium]